MARGLVPCAGSIPARSTARNNKHRRLRTMTELQEVRLRGVTTEDFRRSEKTMIARWLKKHGGVPFRPNDVVLFVSGTGNQLVFVYRDETIDNSDHPGNDEYKFTPSRRLRLDGGTWHPWMLEEYAHKVGLSCNVKSFEEHFETWQKRKRARRRKQRQG